MITNILIESKDNIDQGFSAIKTLKTFFIRRSLRIFPLYYLTLLFFIIFDLEDIRSNTIDYLLYIQNWQYYFNDAMQGQLSPRWSLAVEEQFYLVWPLLILAIPTKHLPKILITLIVSSVLFKLYMFNLYPSNSLIQFLTPSNFDSLSLGGLLAFRKDKRGFGEMAITLILGTIMIIVHSYFRYNQRELELLPIISKSLGYSLISYNILQLLVASRFEFLNRLLENHLIVYLGKISYGIYIYHSMIFPIYLVCGIDIYTLGGPVALIVSFLFLILISSLSWSFVENPINNFKKKFPMGLQ